MFGIGLQEIIIIFAMLSVFAIPGIAGAYLAGAKGRSRIGWFFLCFISPFLIILIIVAGPAKEVKGKHKQCPACKEFVKWDANKCRHCHTSIDSEA